MIRPTPLLSTPLRPRALRVRAKLTLGFLSVVALVLLLGALSAVQLRTMHLTTDDINNRWLPDVSLTRELQTLMNEFRMQEFEHMLAADDGERAPREKRLDALIAQIEKVQADFAPLAAAPAQQEVWKRLQSGWKEYLGEHAKVRKLAQADQGDSARALIRGKSQKLFSAAMVDLQQLVDHGVAQAAAAAADSGTVYDRALVVNAVAMVASLVVGIGLASWFGGHIAKPLGEAARVAEQVARGDLRARFETSRRDEIGELFIALREMVAGLTGVVQNVRSGVAAINTASSEISSATQHLSSRTEQQASELQETSSTLEELAGAASVNSGSANEAHRLASSARQVAADGGQIVDQAVARMADISTSSKRIADITGVIDGIAFQTNILALNAAVEAARAGEQGRGFAVVANEVRVLAQRSAQSAKEIRTLIAASTEQVDAGAALVSSAGRTIHDVVSQVERLSSLIGEISSSTSGQSERTAGIGRSVASLDNTTQQNAAMAEQSAAAAASLDDQARRLSETVAVFQV